MLELCGRLRGIGLRSGGLAGHDSADNAVRGGNTKTHGQRGAK
jgi:hypothetical protein